MSEVSKAVPVLTIDGPSGSGKGTLSQVVARKLGWHLLDSGALYRLTAHAAVRKGLDMSDVQGVAECAASLDVTFLPTEFGEPVAVKLDGETVTREIRSETAGNNASKVAVMPEVRAALLQRQRDFQKPPGLVADGRDMGTVVFPNADVKVFLIASAQARAERRLKQLKGQGEDVKIATLLREIEERDDRDMNRKNAPLRPADDAVTIDTTDLSIEQVVASVMDLLKGAVRLETRVD